MPYTLPNVESSPTYPAQAVPDQTDLQIVAALGNQTGVKPATHQCLVSPGSGYSVNVDSGTIYVAGTSVSVSAVTNLAPSAAPSSGAGDRRDIVVVNSSGTVSITAGTPCGTSNWTADDGLLGLNPPAKPAIPSNSCVLGEIYIPGGWGSTSLASGNLIDKTSLLTATAGATGPAGPTGATGATGAAGAAGSPAAIPAQALQSANMTFASSAPVLTAGSTVVDGYTCLSGDVILLVGQTTASQNGPWVVPSSGSVGTRPTYFAHASTQVGLPADIANGTLYGGTHWHLAAPSGGITVDTTAQTWASSVLVANTANEDVITDISWDQFTPAAANPNAGGFSIVNAADPSLPQSVGTKNYIDTRQPVSLATAAALSPTNTYSNGTSGVGATLTGTSDVALSIDGVAVTAGTTVLIKNEAAANNGVYVVTATGSGSAPYVLTRHPYYNTSVQFTEGNEFLVLGGAANVGAKYYCQVTAPTIGTTGITYVGEVSASLAAQAGQISSTVSLTTSAQTVASTSSLLGNLATYLVWAYVTVLMGSTAGLVEIIVANGTGTIYISSGPAAAATTIPASSYGTLSVMTGVIMSTAGTLTIQGRSSEPATVEITDPNAGGHNTGMAYLRIA